MAVRYNPLTEEPYLQLAAPLSNIIITPHRLNEIEQTSTQLVAIFNDPRVYMWLEGPPYPFRLEDGQEWIERNCRETEEVIATLQAEHAGNIRQENIVQPNAPKFFDVCPFICIREVTERDSATGAPLHDIVIGDMTIKRHSFYELPHGSKARAEAQERNGDLPAGDQNIVWGIGYCLAPSHNGKGLMTEAVRTIIYDWALPRMNLRHLKSSLIVGNHGSRRVLEKNNFESLGTLEDWCPENKPKARGTMSILVLRWKGPV